MSTQKSIRPFGWRDKIGYMFGDLGNDFTFTFASLFLMVFYTKVLGISAATVGVLFVVARALDAFTDVGMGRLVDKMKPAKDGRLRPWIRRMCGPVALASFLMYQSGLANAAMSIKIIYMFVTYLLWGSIFYTSINIPYGAMASVMSEDSGERAQLSTFRSIGAAFANLFVGALAPLWIYSMDANGNQIVIGSRMTLVAGVFSVVSVVCYLICYAFTTERVQYSQTAEAEKGGLGNTLKRMIKDRALIGLILAAILLLLASLLSQSLNQYVFIDYFKNNTGLSVMTVVGVIPAFFLAPFVGVIIRSIGKKEASAIGCFLAGISSLILYFLHVRSMWVFIGITTVGYVGFGFFNLVIWSFITDVIDDQEIKSGKREDGTIYALYSFARKMGQAAAGGLGGFALGMTGYDASVQLQTESVVNGIYDVATLFPGILYIGVGLALMFVYPLSKKKIAENAAILKAKRERNP